MSIIQSTYVLTGIMNGFSESGFYLSRSLYVISEYVLLLNYFKSILIFTFYKKLIKIILVVSILIFIPSQILGLDILTKYYSKFCTIECIIFLVLSITFFLQILKTDELQALFKNSDFIIVAGIFLFFGITSPSYFIFDTIDQNAPKLLEIVNSVNYIAYFFLNISIAVAFKCKRTTAILRKL